jgi:O-antigen/teichoic acid export membrane protein
VLLYPLVLPFLAGSPAFAASVPVFTLLMAGMVLSAGYQPFAMALVQSGFPGLQTVFMGLILTANVIGNAVCIPAFGIDGAAAATGASFVAGVFFLKWLYRKRTGFAL